MKTIAIISQKGGAGKTTLAVHLAVAAERAGHPAAVVDLDAQASATGWGDSRKADAPAVVSAQASRLEKVLVAAQSAGASVAIIDTAPHSESSALSAARASELILIPCRPAILDLRAISQSVDLAKLAGVSAAVVINAVPPRSHLGREAAAAVSAYGLPVSPVQLCSRAAYMHALVDGLTAGEYEPGGKAAEEVERLWQWLSAQMGLAAGLRGVAV
ncbi:ParA family partition ATPase [Gloeobacter morelensis]|uniref:ParA family partition ATPase n=1 Tax=Gloeobacter morelensis TaxID=2907343 RepID=UPI001E2D3AF5|nr:ParA family partition ATPase [Gloeobacter morelensis]UFP97288.1 AAA family ATPase [Gloeobacter morelensis MG652769]